MKPLLYALAAFALLLAGAALWWVDAKVEPLAKPVSGSTAPGGGRSSLSADSPSPEPGEPLASADQPIVESEDPAALQQIATSIGALVSALRNPSLDASQRVDAARRLAELGGRNAAEQLLRAAKDILASEEGASMFGQDIAAQLAQLQGPEAVEVMGEVLTDRNPGFPPFDTLPPLFQQGLSGSLRKNPDASMVAKSIAVQYTAAAGNVAAQSRVELLEHPETTARLSEQAQLSSDLPLLQQRLAMLQTTRDGRVYDSVVGLVQNGVVPRENLDALIYDWARTRPEAVEIDRLVGITSDTSSSNEQRAVAALGAAGYAQAVPEVRASVSEALNKSLSSSDTTDARTLQSFQSALAKLNGQ